MGLNVLHINDNILMLNGLEKILSGGGIDKIDRAQNKESADLALGKGIHQVVIIDPLSGPAFSVDYAEKLISKNPRLHFLIISEVDNVQYTVKLLEKGADGFLTRECDEDEIKHAVFSVAKGEKFYCNKVLDLILNKSDAELDDCEPTVLSERENEIASLIAQGFTNKEIAGQLHLSHHTVHTHRKNILRKLGVKSVSELTLYALKMGLIEENLS